MQIDRFSVTMDPELGSAVRDVAARAGMSVSGWLARAAADRVRNELLGSALDAWAAEDGALSEDELHAAAALLGVRRGASAIDRRDRAVAAMLRVAQLARLPVRTSAAVVGQVWRDGARQANLARARPTWRGCWPALMHST